MSDTIKPGAVVYAPTGQRGLYIGPLPDSGGHAVQPEIEIGGMRGEFYDTELIFAGVTNWDTVYTVEPKLVIGEELVQLNARVEEKRGELGELRQQQAAAERESKETMARIKKAEPLRLIDDFIAGKITHLVIDSGYNGIRVEPIDKALETTDGSSSWQAAKKLRLMTLYGGSNGNLSWGLSKYSDGSDAHTEQFAIPCTSAEMATAEARRLIDKRFAELRKVPDRPWMWVSVIKSATDLGFDVPADLAAALAEYQRKGAEDAVEKARAALAAAEKTAAELAAKAVAA